MDTLALGAAFTILAAVMAFALAFYASAAARTQVRGRLEGVLTGTSSVLEGGAAVTALRETRSVLGALRLFVLGTWLDQIQESLRRADSQLQPLDVIVARIALGGVGFVAGYLFMGEVMGLAMGFVAGLALAVIGFQLPQVWVDKRGEGRRQKLEEQLPETLSLVSNSLKAGMGLLQGLSMAADQMEHPMGTELRQAIHEMNVGSSVEEALNALTERVRSYDLDIVVTAILVQRSVGGNLSEILETVAGTMRERVRIRGEIQTLTAQQRMTGFVIGLLPVVVGVLFLVVSPEYIKVLFTEGQGQVLLGIAAGLQILGTVIIRRILDIEV